MGLRERSVLVLASMFALLFAVLMVATEAYDLGYGFAAVASLAIIGLQWYLGPVFLRWIYRIRWIEPHQLDRLHPGLAAFVEDTCREQGIPVPAIGVIEDGNPNAFAFGRTRNDASLVVTTGLLDILDEEETKAVVAHELGHISHNDFVVMMIASAIPILLYLVFRWSLSAARGRGDRRNRSAPALLAVAAVSYVVYVVSQYLALLLSRVREYYADDFSSDATSNPDALASALIKISYGLVGSGETSHGTRLEAGRALGLADHHYARAFAASARGVGAVTWMDALKAMRWDLANPWGRYFELFSTHPLTARRVQAMEKAAKAKGMTSKYDFEYFESRGELGERSWGARWGTFAYEVVLSNLHIIGALAIVGPMFIVVLLMAMAGQGIYVPSPLLLGIATYLRAVPDFMLEWGFLKIALMGFAVGYLVKTALSYPRGFQPAEVKELVYDEGASPVRGRPVRLEGKIIGRGIPGYVVSEDLVLQDETGFIFLDYHQPFHLLDFLFGLARAQGFVGEKVKVEGWFRRGPAPYVELYRIEAPHDSANVYTYAGRMVTAGALAAVALLVL